MWILLTGVVKYTKSNFWFKYEYLQRRNPLTSWWIRKWKSTTGSALAALTSHSFGSITIGSETLPHKTTQINSKLNNYLVANVQMIFQDPVSSLNPHKNIFKVVSEGIDNLELKTKGGIKNFSPKFWWKCFSKFSWYSSKRQQLIRTYKRVISK